MIKARYFINFLTILFVVFLYTGYFFLQVDIYTGEGAMSRTYNSICGALIVLTMSIFILVHVKSLKAKNSVVLRFVIIWVYAIIIQTILTSEDVGRCLLNFYYVSIWPVSFICLYTISSNSDVLQNDLIIQRFAVLSFVAVLLFYVTARFAFNEITQIGSIGSSYFLMCFVPWVFIVKDLKLRYILIALVAITILISSKRTSILGLALFIFVYVFSARRGRNIFAHFFVMCFFVVAVGSLFYYVDDKLLGGHITERFSNFESGAEARDEIRLATLIQFNNSSTVEKIIGHGYNTVINNNPFGLSAHNDYVETLYDHGLVFSVLQIFIIVRLLLLSYKLYESNNFLFPSTFASVALYVMMAYTTHLILYPYYFCILTGFWGFVEGNYVAQTKLTTHKHSW